MPRREPIDPHGYYHVSSRGTYGRPIFQTDGEHELFLELYERTAKKYGWVTLTWALKWNHHHFAIQLSEGGLSAGMRELHASYSRRIHAMYGQTGKGHLVRHAFFARQATDAGILLAMCRYIDLNGYRPANPREPEEWTWCGYPAAMGMSPARPFHSPSALMAFVSDDLGTARHIYRQFVRDEVDRRSQVLSPNQGEKTVTGRVVVESVA
jgi:REP element-mobilizing transposase RayT